MQQAINKCCQIENYYPQLSNKQQPKLNLDTTSGQQCSQIIQNFYKVDTMKEIEPTTHQYINENIFEEDLSIIIDKLVNLYLEETNKGKEEKVRKRLVLDYLNIYKINSQEIYNWLLNNKTSSNSIYLLGYFNYHGIGTNINMQNAFELYQKAAELENVCAQYCLADMYIDGDILEGVDKNYNKAFELSEKLTEGKHPSGMNKLGYCYEKGIGTEVDKQKAFELFQKAADLGNSNGINSLGYCYDDGIGTEVDKLKAFELFQKAANLGNYCAQYNLALMYKDGDGTKKNMDKANYWFKKSAEQGNQDVLPKLYELSNE